MHDYIILPGRRERNNLHGVYIKIEERKLWIPLFYIYMCWHILNGLFISFRYSLPLHSVHIRYIISIDTEPIALIRRQIERGGVLP